MTNALSDCFGVYKEVLDYGLRFPVNPFIIKVLETYYIGLCQLTPISWLHILGSLATCNMKNMRPSLVAFLYMHTLTKFTKGCRPGWFQLANNSGYITAREKPNKVQSWRNDFIFMRHPKKEVVDMLKVWNYEPHLLDPSDHKG